MPSHWGTQEPQHRLAVESHRHPVSAGVGCAEAGYLLPTDHRNRGSREPFQAGRSHLPVARRRHHERGRVLGGPELRLPAPAPGGHRCRGQRLRDLGACGSADPGRRHLETGDRVSRTCSSRASTALTSWPATARVQEAVAYARARRGPAFVHAKVIRPYSHSLSDDERLYKTPDERAEEADPGSDRADGRVPEVRRIRQRLRARIAAQGDRARSERGGRDRHRRGEAGPRHRAASTSTPRTSIRRRASSRRRRCPRASPTPWSRRSTGP